MYFFFSASSALPLFDKTFSFIVGFAREGVYDLSATFTITLPSSKSLWKLNKHHIEAQHSDAIVMG
ncbi:hypothetical protein J31TS6_53560 [Brevibacillus reuszeri]|nr:hypothetical protein J31TS6_53560 [Brevibacillus reuszeri]